MVVAAGIEHHHGHVAGELMEAAEQFAGSQERPDRADAVEQHEVGFAGPHLFGEQGSSFGRLKDLIKVFAELLLALAAVHLKAAVEQLAVAKVLDQEIEEIDRH